MNHGLAVFFSEQRGELGRLTKIANAQKTGRNGSGLTARKIVHNHNLVTVLQKEMYSVGTDVPGATGNEYLGHVSLSLLD